MNDITGAKHVQIVIRKDGKVIWVNVDDVCQCRVCQIESITLEDQRKHAKKEKEVRKARREGVPTRRGKGNVKA